MNIYKYIVINVFCEGSVLSVKEKNTTTTYYHIARKY